MECNVLKNEVRETGKQKHKNPVNNFLKTKYHEKLKEYKGLCKSKRWQFWQRKFKDIENSIGDPKEFWEKWKNFGETDSVLKEPDIKGGTGIIISSISTLNTIEKTWKSRLIILVVREIYQMNLLVKKNLQMLSQT